MSATGRTTRFWEEAKQSFPQRHRSLCGVSLHYAALGGYRHTSNAGDQTSEARVCLLLD
jgi:hypothetical protein